MEEKSLSTQLVTATLDIEKLDENATLDQAKKADIKLFNFQLDTLSLAYSNVRSIGSLLAINKEVREMIKQRREILGLEYGSPSDKTPRTPPFEPLP